MLEKKNKRNRSFGHRILVISVLCLFGICLAQVKPTAKSKPEQQDKKTKVYLLHSDILRFNKISNPDAQILEGNVSFRQDSVYMYCDSAYFYEAKNSFEAFGNVKMNQGDTLFLYGDWLYYDGNTQIAQVRENVRMENRQTVLLTDSLNYDRLFDLGYFFDGGTLMDEENVLTSEWGEYSPSTKVAVFNYNVKLVNPQFTLTSDTLRYHTDTKVANIVGPSNIDSGENHIYSELGFYNTNSQQAELLDRSVLVNGSRQLTGDSLFYDRVAGYGEAFWNVQMNDVQNKNMLTGNYCFYNELTGYAFATKKAVAIDYSQGDSLFMHADTLKLISYNFNTDSMYRKMLAYHKVRIYSRDMQAVCDSLVFNSLDSCMTMYDNPILWNEQQQLFGEEIKVYMNDSTIDWAHIINQAMSIEQIDSVNYNQVSGKEMKAYFRDGDIYQADVIGNVRIVYYTIDDKDSTLIGVNNAETSLLNVYLKNRKIEKIKASAKTNGTMYPMSLIPEDKRYLPSFAWFDYIRPLNKEDIFVWRGKKAGQELKASVRRDVPLPTLQRQKDR
mgnify:CR=1 FL=1